MKSLIRSISRRWGETSPRTTIRNMLLRSHFQVTVLGLIALLVGLCSTVWLRHNVQILSAQRLPLLQHATTAKSGLEHCLAALRGWVVLNDPSFIEQRKSAWATEVHPAINHMRELETREDGIERLNGLRRVLSDLEEVQWRIEDVAQAPGNQPARLAFHADFEPVAERLLGGINNLIHREERRLLAESEVRQSQQMADLRYLVGDGRHLLGRFVDSGDEAIHDDFQECFQSTTAAMSRLNQHENSFTVEQREILRSLRDDLKSMSPIAADVIAQRRSGRWNVARHLLASEAVPLAEEATDILVAIEADQKRFTDAAAKQVEWTGNLVIAFSAGLIVIMTVAAYTLSHRAAGRLMKPIRRLLHATEKMRNGDLSTDIPVSGSHELSQLTETFNEMRAAIQELNIRSVEQSRNAGMAEVATGVLHNVGNVLNSVNVSGHLLLEKLQFSRIASLSKAAELIDQHSTDLSEFLTNDRRGQHFPRLLTELSSNLRVERDAQVDELRSLLENIEHINTIVDTQQSIARVNGSIELLNPCDIVNNALKINEAAIVRHEVEVIRRFEDVPEITSDRHRLLQILINLISNAKYAVSELEADDRQITVSVSSHGETIYIEVQDNGIGIAQENLRHIFTHGFTTKEDGHGFGLHSCALAAQELGGSLKVQSDGHGEGATFTLQVPLVCEAISKV